MEITEELAAVIPIVGTTKGSDLFDKLMETFQNLDLQWNKLVNITTDGAKNMSGTGIGLIGQINNHMRTLNCEKLLVFHCIIHQQSLIGKVLKFEDVMGIVIKSINFIRSIGLNHRLFKEFLKSIEAEHGDVLYHTDVRWLSRGFILERFFNLRSEIEIFLIEKGREVLELKDEVWIWKLAFMADLVGHLNMLNLQLQGKNKLVSELYSNVKAFENKLALFINQISKCNFAHFKSCQSIPENARDSFPIDIAVNALKKIEEEMHRRFKDFKYIEQDLIFFQNPLSINIEEVKEELQLEVIDLQSSIDLKSEFKNLNLIDFYKRLPQCEYSNLKKFAMKMIVCFGSTYICEFTFSKMSYIKNKYRNTLTDDHLQDILRLSSTEIQPNYQQMCAEHQMHGSH